MTGDADRASGRASGRDADRYRDLLYRRRYLALAGATGAAALAGCRHRDSSTEVHDVAHESLTNQVPSNVQWNMDNSDAKAQISHLALFDPLAKYNFAEAEFTPSLVADWSHADDGRSITLTVREDAAWEDGEAVTAADVARQYELGLLAEADYAAYVDEIDEIDDATVELSFSRPVAPDVVEVDLFEGQVLYAHADAYQGFVDDGDSEGYLDFANREPVASGPWSLSEADGSTLALTRNSDHPDAERINFERYHFENLGSHGTPYASLDGGHLDSAFSVSMPADQLASLPASVEEVQTPAGFGFGLVPNHDHEYLGERAVRQAIAYVVDRQAVADASIPHVKRVSDVPAGIPPANARDVLGGAYDDYEAIDDYETYGAAESLESQATSVLEAEGYTVGDQVEDEGGDVVSFDLVVPSIWSDWVTAAESVVDQLNDFGFDVALDERDYGTLSDTLWPEGDFALSAGSWLPGPVHATVPYYALRHQLVDPADWDWQYNYPPAVGSVGGSTADVTIPGREGDTTTVNPANRLDDLARETATSTRIDIARELAWVANQDLPVIPIFEDSEQTMLTDDDWAIPDDVDQASVAQVRWANTWLPRQGEMDYTGDAPLVGETVTEEE